VVGDVGFAAETRAVPAEAGGLGGGGLADAAALGVVGVRGGAGGVGAGGEAVLRVVDGGHDPGRGAADGGLLDQVAVGVVGVAGGAALDRVGHLLQLVAGAVVVGLVGRRHAVHRDGLGQAVS